MLFNDSKVTDKQCKTINFINDILSLNYIATTKYAASKFIAKYLNIAIIKNQDNIVDNTDYLDYMYAADEKY